MGKLIKENGEFAYMHVVEKEGLICRLMQVSLSRVGDDFVGILPYW